MAERGVKVDHSSLNRWVIQHSSSLALAAKKLKRAVTTSWRMDETYIKVKGKWVYWYRAVDKFGDTVDFILSETISGGYRLFQTSHQCYGFPNKVVIAKSGANYADLENINRLLMRAGLISFVEIFQVNYLNNLIEQDHRFIKKSTNPMMGFKAFHSAKATIDGIETAHMIRKGQLSDENRPAYKQFMALAG